MFAVLWAPPLNPLQEQLINLLNSLLGPSTPLAIPTPLGNLGFPSRHCRGYELLRRPNTLATLHHTQISPS
jgi:hypothetical protein